MRVTYGILDLADANPALGRVGVAGLILNGRDLVEEVAYFRAGEATVFPRGGRAEEVSFAVHCLFATPIAALTFATTHGAELPGSGDLEIELDDGTVRLPAACFQSLRREEWSGCYVRVRYTFLGSAWELVP